MADAARLRPAGRLSDGAFPRLVRWLIAPRNGDPRPDPAARTGAADAHIEDEVRRYLYGHVAGTKDATSRT